VHLPFASRSLPLYIALTISTILRGGVKIVIKLDFCELDPPVEKWLPRAWISADKKQQKLTVNSKNETQSYK